MQGAGDKNRYAGRKRRECVSREQAMRMGLGNENSWEWAQATGMGLGDWNREMGM